MDSTWTETNQWITKSNLHHALCSIDNIAAYISHKWFQDYSQPLEEGESAQIAQALQVCVSSTEWRTLFYAFPIAFSRSLLIKPPQF